MIFKNLNPELTSELLDKCGFKFDGYYYISEIHPVKFNKGEKGFNPSVDANLPQMKSMEVMTYSEFLRILQATMQVYLMESMNGKNFLNPESQVKYAAECIKKYWAFDENLNFMMIINPQMGGIQLTPGNEYTHTMMSGMIREFVVRTRPNESGEYEQFELEIDPACISWPFLITYLNDTVGLEKEIDHVYLKDKTEKGEDLLIPFFGCGLPKPHMNKEE